MLNPDCKFYVYLYRDPSRRMEPIYVGKGTGKRSKAHLRNAYNRHLRNRLAKIRSLGIIPSIEFLCTNVDEELAFLVEEEAIEKFGREDLGLGPLLNMTSGGDGGKHRIETVEQRENRLTALRRIKSSPEHAAKMRASYNNDPLVVAKRAATIKKSWANRKRVQCENCSGVFTPAMYKRWHGENCKSKGK